MLGLTGPQPQGMRHDRRMTRSIGARLACGLVASGLIAAGCSGSSPEPPSGQDGQLNASVASYDLSMVGPQRFLVGLTTLDNRLVSFGPIRLAFSFLGEKKASGTPRPGPESTARWIPVPGTAISGPRTGPRVTLASQARGVYQAEGLRFDRAGFWQVVATADVQDLGARSGTAAFQVGERPAVSAPGQRAPASKNLTLSSKGPRAAIDSRASTGPIPDPELHRNTVAAALAAHRPIVVVISTPVYCVSRFCGPITDTVQGLAKRYGDRATFIHIEVWHDFQKMEINRAAADWIYRGGDLQEPWVYFVGSDGIIKARWDNVFDPAELEAMLQALPG